MRYAPRRLRIDERPTYKAHRPCASRRGFSSVGLAAVQWRNQATPRLARRSPSLRGRRYDTIECELPTRKVVLSDFEAWHFVLDNWYLALSEEGRNQHDDTEKLVARSPTAELREELKRTRNHSWGRIFDLDLLKEPWHCDTKDNMIQACFWELRLEQVTSTKWLASSNAQSPWVRVGHPPSIGLRTKKPPDLIKDLAALMMGDQERRNN